MKARWLTSSTDGPVCSGAVDSTKRPRNSMANRSNCVRRRLICAASPSRCTSWRSSSVPRATRPRRGGCSSSPSASRSDSATCKASPPRCTSWRCIERDQGNPAEARRLLQQSLGISERLGDLRGQSASLHELAIIESAQGNPAEARRLLQQSLGIQERLGDLQGQAASLHVLASIERDQGNPAEARRLLQQSLGITERLGDLRGQAASLHELAIIESDQGNPAEARRLLQQSLGI